MVEVGGYADVSEQEANTHPIAAAPDMAEVLMQFVRRYDAGDHFSDKVLHEYRRWCGEALARAGVEVGE